MTDMADYIPHPGSRLDAMATAEAAVTHPSHAVAAEFAVDMKPRPVKTVRAPSAHASYYTVVIPASTATTASVRQILPRDDTRVIAYIQPVDGPVIVATTIEQAQDPVNIAATFPTGAYSPVGGYTVTHREAVYACNPSTSASCRVAVLAETGGAE